MTLFQYTARKRDAPTAPVRGEVAAATRAEARAALRRIGLQVLEVRPLTIRQGVPAGLLREAWHRHVRNRRRSSRSELFDGLATLLGSGLPLLESIEALRSSAARASRPAALLLMRLREALKGGSSFSDALRAESAWFDGVECAMIAAGERAGTLPGVLRSLSERQERSAKVAEKLAGALAYPAVVLLLGIGVVVFLSTQTLPELVRILTDAKVEPPALTSAVVVAGSVLTEHGILLLLGLLLVGGGALVLPTWLARSGGSLDRLRPELIRRMRVAGVASGIAELLFAGVPLVESVRVVAPTLGRSSLQGVLRTAAERLERGDPPAVAFSGTTWFDAEFLRLLELGTSTGELPALLERVGARYRRSAERAIDRAAAILEPAAIVALATLVGTVALAAVLPLVRLREVF